MAGALIPDPWLTTLFVVDPWIRALRVVGLIEMVCRECGCSDDDACPEGCAWVGPGLCSSCDFSSAGSRDRRLNPLGDPDAAPHFNPAGNS